MWTRTFEAMMRRRDELLGLRKGSVKATGPAAEAELAEIDVAYKIIARRNVRRAKRGKTWRRLRKR